MAEHRLTTAEGHRFIIRVQRNGLVQIWRDFSTKGKKMEAIMTKSRRDKAFANLRLALACQEGKQ
jgi:hypothetical protein